MLVDMVVIKFYKVSGRQIYSYMIITNLCNLACSQYYNLNIIFLYRTPNIIFPVTYIAIAINKILIQLTLNNLN